MFDPKLYREVCRELTAPEDKIEEVIAMTENMSNKKRCRPLRAVLICAAAFAMMVVGVSAANPGMVADIAGRIAEIIQVDPYKIEMITEDGSQIITVYSAPQATVENRDGRAILLINGEDVGDITDVLNAEGCYYYEGVAGDDRHLTVTVEGTAEEWTATVTIGDLDDPDGPVTTYSSMNGGRGFMSAPAVSIDIDDIEPNSSYEYETEDGVKITVKEGVFIDTEEN